jgi:hypothetical protein
MYGKFGVGEIKYSCDISAHGSIHKLELKVIGLMQRSDYVRSICTQCGEKDINVVQIIHKYERITCSVLQVSVTFLRRSFAVSEVFRVFRST